MAVPPGSHPTTRSPRRRGAKGSRTSKSSEAVRITTAPASPGEELDNRVRRYVIAMTIRTLCFVAAFFVGPGWLRWVLVAGAVLLPYFAVVAANVTSQKNDGFDLEPVDAPALGGARTAEELQNGSAP